MSQSIWSTIVASSTSGNQLATLLNDFKDAVISGFSGTTRPTEIDPGGYWIDTTNNGTGIWYLKIYDGTQDITLFTINKNTGTASIFAADSQFEITKQSADAIGPILKMLKKRIATNGQTLDGDTLGEVDFYGTKDNGSTVMQARIKAVSTDDVTGVAQGSILVFEVIPDATSAFAEAMRLVDLKLAIGRTTADEKLDVEGNIKARNNSDTANGANLVLAKKRVAGGGQVLLNDSISKIENRSMDIASTDFIAANIEVIATENQTATARGNKTVFRGINKTTNTLITKLELEDKATFNIPIVNPILEEATISDTFYQYYGDKNTNGSFRIGVSSGELVIEKRVTAVWTNVGSFNE